MRILKLVLEGDQGAGKSCLVKQFVNGNFDLEEQPTVGVVYDCKLITANNEQIKLQIWDTAGRENFRTIVSMYYTNTSIFLLCCDVTNRASFDNLKSRLSEICEYVPKNCIIGLVGTKADIGIEPKVSNDELKNFCNKNKIDFLGTCSAKDKTNVDVIFITATEKFLENQSSAELVDEVRTHEVQTDTASYNTLPTTQQLREKYKAYEGGSFHSGQIFGFFSDNTPDECIAELKKRSNEDPNGASAKTLRFFGLLKATNSAKTIAEGAQHAQSSSLTSAATNSSNKSS